MKRTVGEVDFEGLSEFFGGVANPYRLKILFLLSKNGELCVNDLMAKVGLSQTGTSRYLEILYQQGLLKKRRDWNRIYYSLTEKGEKTVKLLEKFFNERERWKNSLIS